MSDKFQLMNHRVVALADDDATRALICLTLTGPAGDHAVCYRLDRDAPLRNSLRLEIGVSRLGMLEIPIANEIPVGDHDVEVLIEGALLDVSVVV